MSGWPTGISTITLFAEDLEATKSFYQDVFGLGIVFGDDASAVFDFGNTLVNLLRVESAPELIVPARVGEIGAGPRALLTITVDDVDATCALLAERGVQLLNGPIDRPWGVRTAAFLDPAGNAWEVAQQIGGGAA